MKAVLVGVGQAGGKLTTALASFDSEMGFGAVLDALAVNTASADLDPLPMDSVLIGQSRVSGHGVGGDNELGAELMEADSVEVLDALAPKWTRRRRRCSSSRDSAAAPDPVARPFSSGN